MATKQVRFYVATAHPLSPSPFLASNRIENERVPLGVEREYKPVYSPRSGGGPT